jgi:4-amino-4-deoxy-L-arabinose transferase-like glycosyltransferase
MVATRLRAVTFAALAATTASVAHGGLQSLTEPTWAIPALAGAGLATVVMWRGWVLVADRRELHRTASLAALIPAMLIAQAAAHAALLTAGAPAHDGAAGSLALHLALAVVAAVLVHRIDVHTVERAVRAQARPHPGVTDPEPPATARRPPRGIAAGLPAGRAPPLTV